MNRAWLSLWAAALSTGLASPARADDESVQIELPACTTLSFDGAELQRLLKVELGQDGWLVVAAEDDKRVDSHVTLDVELCAADETEVIITIVSNGPTLRAARIDTRLSLHDVPYESRARTLAVGVAELLRLARHAVAPSTAEPSPKKEPPETAPPPVAAIPTAAPPPAFPRPPLSLEVFASARGLAGQLPAFLGGGLAARFRLDTLWSLRAELEGAYSSGRVRWGRLETTALSAAAAAELTLLEQPRITLGPTMRVLTLLAQGQSNLGVSEAMEVDWALSVAGHLALEATINESFALVLSGELGGYLRELIFTGVSIPIASFSGFTGGLTIGLAYDL